MKIELQGIFFPFFFFSFQSITPPESSSDPNNMTLLAEEARRLAER